MDPALIELTSYMRQNLLPPKKKKKTTKHIYKVKYIQINTHMNNQDRNAKRYCVNNFLELPRSVTEGFLKEKSQYDISRGCAKV